MPEFGVSNPAIMRRSVVLPQPDGPSRKNRVPGFDPEINAGHRDGGTEFLHEVDD